MQALGMPPGSEQEKPEGATSPGPPAKQVPLSFKGPSSLISTAPPTSGREGTWDRKLHSRVGPVGLAFHGDLEHPPVPESQGETGMCVGGAHLGGAWEPDQEPRKPWLFLAMYH